MAGMELRPLSLGEILDRTFWLYRRHFLLFFGLSAIPQVLGLAVNLTGLALGQPLPSPATPFRVDGLSLAVALATIVVMVIGYLFSQGGSVFAISELYLGHDISIAESLRRVWQDLGFLFGVIFLNGLVLVLSFVLLIIPGFYMMCRLMVCVPAALIETRGPTDSLRRSFDLTRGSAGRAFVILLLSFVLGSAVGLLLSTPFTIGMMVSMKDPLMLRFWTAMTQIGSSLGNALVQPILLIATGIFYFDLRVRKEAFDLQFMMDPDFRRTPGATGVPSILS